MDRFTDSALTMLSGKKAAEARRKAAEILGKVKKADDESSTDSNAPA